ncbi:endo-1,4-beta-glucanase [Diplogelasinospora grovesii]|uniref:lytic cellulose monooxygenase (C4-dehydrogenating) n=1 Tax=Diplogelasinospora grovesii TaxID=303347 RepID=A0AAN6N5S3_9PEZI|nr:endo-1,4-beta-glucanase [Diplogelasinospora grovesii]
MLTTLATLAPLLLFFMSVAAHSHIDYLIINGLVYGGFDPTGRTANPPSVVGWSTTVEDDGFVPPSNYSTPDIVCHRNGSPAKVHAPVKAGDKIHVQWNGWPESHRGPVMSYLAPCTAADGGCASVDKTKLSWTKIDNSAPALLNYTGGLPGLWATNVLIGSNNSWLVGIPEGLETGPYVLRHELLALHYAARPDGAQNYPQCLNLWVEGRDTGGVTSNSGGSNETVLGSKGIPAVGMYKANDPGVAIDIYAKTLTTYIVPGPTVVSGAQPVPMSMQVLSLPTAAGTPVVVVSGAKTLPFVMETGAMY